MTWRELTAEEKEVAWTGLGVALVDMTMPGATCPTPFITTTLPEISGHGLYFPYTPPFTLSSKSMADVGSLV